MERKSTRKGLAMIKPLTSRQNSRPSLRRSTVKKSTAILATPKYSPHQTDDGFDFDLRELSADDVEFINSRNYQNMYENEFHRQISSTVASHGVKAAADGDLEYIEKLLTKTAEFASTTSVHIHDLIKICNVDGWNMFHAAVVYKRVDVMIKILEYGTEIVQDPVEDETEDTPLILAIKNFTSFLKPVDLISDSPANVQVVKLLIQFGADINAANKKGDTPLIYAVKVQLPEIVSMLTQMEMDTNVNATNAIGTTALHYAAAFDNKEIASILLRLNAEIFAADKTGKNPVHIACKYGSRRVLKLILDANGQLVRKIIRECDSEGNTPLMLAKSALNFSSHNIELLIACGSHLQAFNHNHNRVLHFYSRVDDKEINESILHKEQTLLQHKNYDLETPLHIAAKYGHKDTCFLYAEKGADIFAKDSSGNTPMMNAVAYGHKDVVKILFNFGYTVDTVVKHGKMLLEWAVELEYLSLIEAMTDHDPNTVLENTYKETNVIHYVCKLGAAPILQYLLNWNESRDITRMVTKPDSLFGKGHCPLHIAVEHGYLECVKLLVKYGADVKVKVNDEKGDTALHIAARKGHLEILKFLLSQGLDPESSNVTEGTALASAAHAGKVQIVSFLLNIGVSANGSNEKYHLKTTPLLLAAKEGHGKVVKLLLEKVVDVSVATEDGHNCLVEAILNRHRCTAIIIIQSDYWRRAMQFQTKNNETPMRLMIEHMPEVAEFALHRCVEYKYKSDDKGGSEIVEIEYSYEFLDDFVTPKPTLNAFMADLFRWNRDDKHERMVEEDTHPAEIALETLSPKIPYTQHDSESIGDEMILESSDENWLQEKFNQKNHPLELMVQHKRTGLLQTPVVEEMRDRKWKTFGLPVFTISISVYILFLALLTAAVLVGPFPQSELCNASGCWGQWGSWSSCMASSSVCYDTMERTRSCDPGFGIFNGCDGKDRESRNCIEMDPVLGFIQVDPSYKIIDDKTENVTFDCSVTRTTPFSVMWLNESMDVLCHSDDSSCEEVSINDTINLFLRIHNVTTTSLQNYTCVGIDDDNITFARASATLTSFECQDPCHVNLEMKKKQSCEERGVTKSDSVFLIAADVMIIIFSAIQLLLEFSQMWRRGTKYIRDLENWLEVLVFVLSIMFVIYHIEREDECSCPDRTTWTVGILAVFLGYMDLVFYLRRVPITGITISIMYNIFTTFLELIFIAALLIFAFALPFHMLLVIPDRRTPFSNVARSMLKTLVMTTGEFEFDTIFINDQELVDEGLSLFIPWLTGLLWVIFVIVMPILFSNLLVGLAVGDTQEERAKAQLTKISLQVRLILELEETMSVFRYYARTLKMVFTQEHVWYDIILGNTKIERRVAQLNDWEQKDIFTNLERELIEEPLDEIKESLNQQMECINDLQANFEDRLDRLEDQLSAFNEKLEESRDIQSTKKDFDLVGSSSSLNK